MHFKKLVTILNIFLFIIISNESCLSQETADDTNILKSKEIIKIIFDGNVNYDYLLYIIRDKYIVIVREPSNYVVNFILEDKGLEHKTIYKRDNKDLDDLFNPKSYVEKRALSGLDYANDCPLTYIYWVVNIEGVKITEFNLPSMLLCSEKKVKYPVSNDLMALLFNMVNDFWYSNKN